MFTFIKFLILAIVCSIVISCGNTDNKVINSSRTENLTPKKLDTTQTDFDLFLKHFNSDSAFQISHIDFPIKVHEIKRESDNALTEKITNFRILDLSANMSISEDNYTRVVKTNNNNATVELLGNETGFMIAYFFEKINGKWLLISWIDKST